jgi:hypothetical protein
MSILVYRGVDLQILDQPFIKRADVLRDGPERAPSMLNPNVWRSDSLGFVMRGCSAM